MFIDLAKTKISAPLKVDIVIVGSGPAGLALAIRLQSLGRDVLLLESGTFDYSDAAQDLNDGEDAMGRTHYLRTSRIRAFGGTSFHWGGHCGELDPIDFTERNWIKHSGWPISKADLVPYYSAARPVCNLDPAGFDTEKWSKLRDQPTFSFKDGDFSTPYFQVQPTRFGDKYRAEVETSKKITALLNATVTAVRLESNGASCKSLSVAGPDGKTFEVTAAQYVLACGGIENARLLLISDDVRPNGVGNDNDLLGRYFMDHGEFISGALIPTDPKLDVGFYINSHPKFRGYGTITPTPALVQKLQSVNFTLFLVLKPSFLDELKANYWDLAHKVRKRQVFDDFGDNLSKFFSMIGSGASYAWASLMNRDQKFLYADIGNVLESSPNPDSRVTVNKAKKDRLGQPVVRLDWRVNAGDIDGWARGQEVLAMAVGKSGIGRMRFDFDPAKGMKGLRLDSIYHHTGTTRMHRDPKQGVVDEHCRVHGVSNLYIAGSSVFPTNGYVNPTLTIVALALRLADHLGRKEKQ